MAAKPVGKEETHPRAGAMDGHGRTGSVGQKVTAQGEQGRAAPRSWGLDVLWPRGRVLTPAAAWWGQAE